MARKNLQKIDARIRKLIIRIAADAKELNDLRVERHKIVTGKVKAEPPPGKKVLFTAPLPPEFEDGLDDLRPVAPGSCGPC